jgi:hypothetical protein
MSFTKEKIYNLALSALLLSDEVIEISTSKSNNIAILNRFYDVAFQSTLQDLDLDSLSQPIALELIDTITDGSIPWTYVYKYPSNCIFFRRINSGFVTDNKNTHIAKKTGIHKGQKAIFTNQPQAIAECIPKDVPLEALSPMAALAVSYKLAIVSAPLITGKGAKTLRKEINENYIIAKTEAQETDVSENFNYESDWQRSEFVEARLS